jgi:hypothetical protein
MVVCRMNYQVYINLSVFSVQVKGIYIRGSSAVDLEALWF